MAAQGPPPGRTRRILADVIYEIFAPIEAVAFTQSEWDQGDSFVTDFARDGEILFAA